MNRFFLILFLFLYSFVSAQTENKIEYGSLPLSSELKMDFAILPDYQQYGSASTFHALFDEDATELYVIGGHDKVLQEQLDLPENTHYIDEDLTSALTEINSDGSIRYIDLDKKEVQFIKGNEMNSGLKKWLKNRLLSKSDTDFKRTTYRSLGFLRFSIAGTAVFTAIIHGTDFIEMIHRLGAESAYSRAMILALATVIPGTAIQLNIEKFERFTQTDEYEKMISQKFKEHLPKVYNAIQNLKFSNSNRNKYFKAIKENGIVKTIDRIRQNIIPNWNEAGKWQYTEYAISGAILLASASMGFEKINAAALVTFLLITKITALTQGTWEIHAFQAREAVEKMCAQIEDKINTVKDYYAKEINTKKIDLSVHNAKRLAQLKMSLKALMGSVTWSIGAVLGMAVPADQVSASSLFEHITQNQWSEFFSTVMTHKIALFNIGNSMFYTPAPSALAVFGVLGAGAYLTSSHFNNLSTKITSKLAEAKTRLTCNKIFSKF